jgi:SPX domain protein involved in polyphosphate accumulation
MLFNERLKPDAEGLYNVSNVYADTDKFDVIRHSIDKPVYKEKLRLRAYGKTEQDAKVFVELKRKFNGVVSKRRIKLPYDDARSLVAGEMRGIPAAYSDKDRQVFDEIAYFLRMYPVYERVFIGYDRLAFLDHDDHVRVTLDTDIRFRTKDLDMGEITGGTRIMDGDSVLMEVKTSGAVPLWLCDFLSANNIMPVSFSKYGTVYSNYILARG